MIDWLGVFTNGLWITGLAGMLATVSYYVYVASQQGKLRAILGSPPFVFYFSVSTVVFCLGVATSGGALWERIAWGVLAGLFAWQAWQNRKKRASSQ
jgi:hypothetical protein